MAGAFTSFSTLTLTLARHSFSLKPSSNSPPTNPFLLFRPRSFSLSCSSTSTSNFTSAKGSKNQVISEGTDEDLGRDVCPGCGVFMQDSDPDLPGYYVKPSIKDKEDESGVGSSELDEIVNVEEEVVKESLKLDLVEELEEEDFEEFDLNSDSDEEDSETVEKTKKKSKSDNFVAIEDELTDDFGDEEEDFDWDSDLEEEEEKEEKEISKPKKGAKTKAKSSKKPSYLDQFLEEEEESDYESENEEFEDESEEFDFSDDEEESDLDKDWDDLTPEEKRKLEMDGFAPPGVGYGNITPEYLQSIQKPKISKSDKKKQLKDELKKIKKQESLVTVCARCHSLRNYGSIKNPNVENLIPDFDFDRFISTRLTKQTGTGNVVVLVVDCTDFDGSFPKTAAKSLFTALQEPKKSKLSKLPKLILVATKVDLLPSQVSPARLDKWVRSRSKANGAHKPDEVILVSSHKDLNIRNLINIIKNLAGPRGNVWVVGAQNAGKSTLINAFAKKEGVKITKLTEAAVPGTTLGILRVTGILPAKVKMYDTPGLLHPGLVANRLSRAEQKMVEIRKELKPRSYRIKAGQTVHVGGLMRLDLVKASVETIYVTVWASPNISLHMGKIDNSDELRAKHFGTRLQPPIGENRAAELGNWTKRELKVSGSSWDVNSVDIAVAGLGWYSLGLKGEANVELWTFEGVEVAQREPLVLDRARILERAGFWLPKAISDEIGRENKRKAEARKRLEDQFDDEEEEEEEDLLLEASF
ncbi:hypothetical protein LUZ60_012786 [Juncus effusus]|nr:hypothetical protein LUZ60_012786 [Juncus effusus]